MNNNTAQVFFKNKTPTRTLCYAKKSGTDDCKKQYSLKDKAFKKATHLQCNPYNLICFLVMDVDHEDAAFAWSDQGLPCPNIITLNKDNGKGHYVFFLKAPVAKGENARLKPLAYFAAIQHNYTQLLGADPAYTNLITKNPFHKNYRTNFISDHQYDLDNLAKPLIDRFGHVPSSERISARVKNIVDIEGCSTWRNINLFDALRHWGYRAVHEFREKGDRSGWMRTVETMAFSINQQFDPPMMDNEVRSVIRSVGQWIWEKYHGSGGKRRGIMNLEETGFDLELSERQSIGAQFVAKVKVDASREKIIDAIGVLTSQSKKVSKAAVSRLTGLHRNTLANYQDLFR